LTQENILYDTIGKGYNNTRTADPLITEMVYQLLRPMRNGVYLDIGCGTGNYTMRLAKKGLAFFGIDPSEEMLKQARMKSDTVQWMEGIAEKIPMDENYFDGAIAMFTFHHWTNKQQGLKEVCRVLKEDASIVFLSFTAEQMKHYWLNHYFPEMIERAGSIVPTESEMNAMLRQAGFYKVISKKYFVHKELKDQFLYANKYRPELYLDENIRRGISAFSAFTSNQELDMGLKKLKKDIVTGKINSIIASYENEVGDYLFYKATKK
jgi:ubiquinone/menaquinone biosynthesis C-methylase UbiE